MSSVWLQNFCPSTETTELGDYRGSLDFSFGFKGLTGPVGIDGEENEKREGTGGKEKLERFKRGGTPRVGSTKGNLHKG